MKAWLACLGIFLSVVPRAAAQDNIRFGVLGLFHPRVLELAWRGEGALSISGGGDPIVLNGEHGHRSVVLQAIHGKVLLAGHTAGRIVCAGREHEADPVEVIVPGRFRRVYRGRLEITARGDELIPVLSLQLDTAVATVVASEMPPGAPLEAIKAQAVVTRSFLSAGRRHQDFDFCDTTHCQYLRSPTDVSDRVWAAVRATQRVILTWRDRPIAALYSSRCGGTTRSLREAGIDPGGGYPYFSVECRWCKMHTSWQAQPSTAARRHWGDASHADSDRLASPFVNGPVSVGHRVGMCQHGAIGMALTGTGFRAILMHYYPNAGLSMLP